MTDGGVTDGSVADGGAAADAGAGYFAFERVGLSSDGLTLVGVAVARTSMAEFSRTVRGQAFFPYPQATHLTPLSRALYPGELLGNPVISSDGSGSSTRGTDWTRQLPCTRLFRSGPVAWGTGSPQASQDLAMSAGLRRRPLSLSADRLTLFVWDEVTSSALGVFRAESHGHLRQRPAIWGLAVTPGQRVLQADVLRRGVEPRLCARSGVRDAVATPRGVDAVALGVRRRGRRRPSRPLSHRRIRPRRVRSSEPPTEGASCHGRRVWLGHELRSAGLRHAEGDPPNADATVPGAHDVDRLAGRSPAKSKVHPRGSVHAHACDAEDLIAWANSSRKCGAISHDRRDNAPSAVISHAQAQHAVPVFLGLGVLDREADPVESRTDVDLRGRTNPRVEEVSEGEPRCLLEYRLHAVLGNRALGKPVLTPQMADDSNRASRDHRCVRAVRGREARTRARPFDSS